MRNSIFFIAFILILSSCKETNYAPFGKEITADNAIEAKTIGQKYASMKIGDSINTKIIAKVNSVCQAKGCWMKVELDNETEAMVKFKDYGFFMPEDISGKQVVMNGIAFVNEVPVDELRHYAEDAGKTEEEIAAITKPKRTYSFLADGVLLPEEAKN